MKVVLASRIADVPEHKVPGWTKELFCLKHLKKIPVCAGEDRWSWRSSSYRIHALKEEAERQNKRLPPHAAAELDALKDMDTMALYFFDLISPSFYNHARRELGEMTENIEVSGDKITRRRVRETAVEKEGDKPLEDKVCRIDGNPPQCSERFQRWREYELFMEEREEEQSRKRR